MIANLLFVVWLALSILINSDWLTYVVVAFIWLMLGLYCLVLIFSTDFRMVESKPGWGLWTDLFAVALLVFAEWYVTAIAYIASVIALELIRRRPRRVDGAPK